MSDLEQNNVTANNVANHQPLKRGRGRPRKNSQPKKVNVAARTPSKRGRKPKSSSGAKSPGNPGAKRGRGRPRKMDNGKMPTKPESEE